MAQLPSVLYYAVNKMDVYSNWNKYRSKSHFKRLDVVIVCTHLAMSDIS